MGTSESKVVVVTDEATKTKHYIKADIGVCKSHFFSVLMPMFLKLEETALPVEVRATILNIPVDTYRMGIRLTDSISYMHVNMPARSFAKSSILLGWTVSKCREIAYVCGPVNEYKDTIASRAYLAFARIFNDILVLIEALKCPPTTSAFTIPPAPLFYQYDNRVDDKGVDVQTFMASRVKAYTETRCAAVRWAENEYAGVTVWKRAAEIGLSMKEYQHLLDSDEYKNENKKTTS